MRVPRFEQGRGSSRLPPFRANSRQASRDLSLTCLMSGLDLALRVSVWLEFAFWAGGCSPRRVRPQERFDFVFSGVPAASLPSAFADLENRLRRKSFVGLNPTPSVWVFASSRRGSFLSALPGFVSSGSESLRASVAPDCFAFCLALDRRSALGFLRPSSSSSVGTCFGFGVCPTARAPRGPEVAVP